MYLDEITTVQDKHNQKRYYESRLTDSVSDQQTESEESYYERVLYDQYGRLKHISKPRALPL